MGYAALAGAVLGGIAGNKKDRAKVSQQSSVDVGTASAYEAESEKASRENFMALDDLVRSGPGQSDVTASVEAQRALAKMFGDYSAGGYQPTDADIASSNSLADKLFGARRVAMGQAFEDQTTQANRQAALMGRSVNDPILRAKLAQEQTRQSNLLAAEQGGWATQYSMQQPMMRLDFASQRANILGGLATQAMSNRQALIAMGNQNMALERNWRLGTATRFGEQGTESGGGFKGFVTGAFGGAAAMQGIMSGGMGGQQGGGSAAGNTNGAYNGGGGGGGGGAYNSGGVNSVAGMGYGGKGGYSGG